MSESILTTTKIVKTDSALWSRNAAIHLPDDGALRSWICRDADAPLLVLFPDTRRARDFAADFEVFESKTRAECLPEYSFSRDEAQNKAVSVKRGAVMSRFKSQGVKIVAATAASIAAPFMLGGEDFELRRGHIAERQQLLNWLDGMGYERCDLVWSPGQFAVRGSIIDIFSPSSVWPVRLEFFDDEIESIRIFMPDSQKSISAVDTAFIQGLNGDTSAKISDFLPENMRVVYFDPAALDVSAENNEWLRENFARENATDVSDWPKWQEIRLLFSKYPQLRIVRDIEKADFRLDVSKFPYFRGRSTKLDEYCAGLVSGGFKITVCSEIAANIAWAEKSGFEVRQKMLSGGFIDRTEKIAFISDAELSGMTLSVRQTEKFTPKDWGEELIPGQWVVHDDYGLSTYIGTQLVDSANGLQEYIVLNFADDQRLLVPLMQFYKITPYSPAPGEEPEADNLRGTRWRKSAERARRQAAEAAAELAEVYAKRELSKGFAFEKHPELMKEIEDGFGYTETSDQLSAIEDVLADMSLPVPMDRLLVGDVGFGKTEVVLRAAAEAVFNGKQAAILTPTTLLANQHFHTFSLRFASLPVRVEMVSRFVSAKQQKKILSDLAEGKVDIIIGTHRLLSADVCFKDLGLIVVDEEHRFGVMHKDKLKKLTPGVDVLMVSATPIPRSLSLSLNGLRDMSLLETPPQRRLPVITVVGKWSEEMLKSAVFREKARGGQIFFIHNRIKDIQERYVMLKRLFPNLTVSVAHSKMNEAELENVMQQFTDGKTDILICTTIIESGLDIPSANTLVVDDSHELGLAQMYQLRGRVGRRDEQAYAFMFYPQDVTLTREAEERLDAIAELDELGSGYRLAKTDLQIRGGGDVVGVAQHGHNGKIGYTQYCDILSEEIAKIKGEQKLYADVRVGFPLSITPNYLPQESLRVAFYRRMLKISSLAEELELRAETKDRFGKLPQAVDLLLKLNAVRAELAQLGAQKIEIDNKTCRIYGETSQMKQVLKLPLGWFPKSDGSIEGHGGYRGIEELYRAIKILCQKT